MIFSPFWIYQKSFQTNFDRTRSLWAKREALTHGEINNPAPSGWSQGAIQNENVWELKHPSNIPPLISERGLPFVGRKEEFNTLVRRIEETAIGNGGVYLVSGEAGIGKTRLAQELVRRAEALGFRCLFAKGAAPGESTLYSPWIEFIRQFSQQASAQLFFKVCGTNIDHVIRLVPELFESAHPEQTASLDKLKTPVSAPLKYIDFRSPEEFQRREAQFFLALTQFFFKLAEYSPVLLIFDDVHWCDASTVRLIEFLDSHKSAKTKILLLCLCRDIDLKEEEQNPEVARFIAHQKQLNSIELRRFTEDNVDEIISELFAHASKDAAFIGFRKFLFSRTGGNPLFIGEVLKSFVERGIISRNEKGEWSFPHTAAGFEIPSTIRNMIKQRLDRLDSFSLDTLRIASVIGEEFTLETLVSLLGPTSSGNVIDALGKAMKMGLLVEVSEHISMEKYYRFSDEMVRDILYDELSPKRRQQYHLVVGELLEEKYEKSRANSTKEHARELANHYFKGENFLKAEEYFIKAAQNASELFAHLEARAYFIRALEILEKRIGKTDILSRAVLIENIGNESQFIPDYESVFDYWKRAAYLYEQCGEMQKAAHLLGNLGLIYHLVTFDLKESKRAYEKGLSLARPDDVASTAELARLTSYDVLADIWSADTRRLKEKVAKAVKLASQSGAYDVLAMASCYTVAADPASDVELSIESCTKGLAIALEHNLIWEAAYCYFHRAISHTYVYGPSPKSLGLFLEGVNFTASRGYFMVNLFHQFSLVCDAYLPLGEWQKARETAENVLQSVRPFSENSLFRLGAEITLANVLLNEGSDLAKVEEYLSHIEKVTKGFGFLQLDVSLYASLARLNIEKKEMSKAQRYLAEGYRLSQKRGLVVVNALPHVRLLDLMIEFHCLSNDAAEGFDQSLVEERLAELGEVSKAIRAEWPNAYYARSHGLMAAKKKDYEESISSLEKSIQIFEKLQWPYEIARTQYFLGLIHLRRGNVLSSAKQLSTAHDIFSKLGAKGDLAKIASVRSRIEEQGIPLFDEHPKFLNKESELVFENLLTEFMQDFLFKKMDMEKCGWRSLSELFQILKISKHVLYGRKPGTIGPVLKELLSTDLVESKTFAGERGRGGEIMKIRISYGKTPLKRYAAQKRALEQ
jgi:tetratricopeptide (TPR) repeat protein